VWRAASVQPSHSFKMPQSGHYSEAEKPNPVASTLGNQVSLVGRGMDF
jgi:hypothetical protein